MARYINNVRTSGNMEAISREIADYLTREGFKYKSVKGENVWQKGSGMITAPQFIKVQLGDGIAHIEAWLKQALLPGVYVGEMGLDGFYGAIPKSMLKGRVMQVERILQSGGAPVNLAANAAAVNAFCRNCGKQLQPGAQFCEYCGSKVQV